MSCDNFHFSPHPVLGKYQTSLYSKVFSAAKRGKIKYQANIASGPSSTCKILVSMLKLLTFTQIFSATKQVEKSKKKKKGVPNGKKPRVQNSELKVPNLCSNSLSSMHFSKFPNNKKIQDPKLHSLHFSPANRQGKPTS